MSEPMDRAHRSDAGHLAIHCPGCGHAHRIDIKPSGRWTFNGDFVRPTFTPSLNVSHAAMKDGEETDDIPPYRCHSVVTDGHIQFLGDSTHALAGQTVDLPPWRDE